MEWFVDYNYARAIENYKALRKQMIDGINKQATDDLKLTEKNFIKRLNNEPLEFDDPKGTELMKKLDDWLIKQLYGKGIDNIALPEELKITKDNIKDLSKKIDQLKRSEIIGQVDEIVEDIKTKVYNKFKYTFGKQKSLSSVQEASIDNFIRRRILLSLSKDNKNQKTIYQTNAQYSGYTSVVKGYMQEIHIANLINKLYGKFGVVAEQIGDDLGQADIGMLIKKLGAITNEESVVNIPIKEYDFSIQRKWWDLPEPNIKEFYSVGENKKVYDKLKMEEVVSLSIDISRASFEIMELIGKTNVLYATKNAQLIWTADLIDGFIKAKKYLMFYVTHKDGKLIFPPTTEVIWGDPNTGR